MVLVRSSFEFYSRNLRSLAQDFKDMEAGEFLPPTSCNVSATMVDRAIGEWTLLRREVFGPHLHSSPTLLSFDGTYCIPCFQPFDIQHWEGEDTFWDEVHIWSRKYDKTRRDEGEEQDGENQRRRGLGKIGNLFCCV